MFDLEGAGPFAISEDIMPPQTNSARPMTPRCPDRYCRADTETGDLVPDDTQRTYVSSDLADDLTVCDARKVVVVGEIIHHHRRYEDLRRAFHRLDLQTKSIIRFAGDGPPVEVWLIPYREAMAPLASAAKDEEKHLAKLAKGLPVAAWAKSVAGLSDRFLALIVGEAGRPISDYRSPACLWKRMGLAVIDGERQRRVTGDAALLHGYVARRRALVWNLGESVLKQQLRKGEDGNRRAIGPYGQIYIDRRAHEVANKGEKYSHARAKRYMEKRIIKDLWRAWRASETGGG